MKESSTSWVAILTLHEQTNNLKNKEKSEPYILSKEEATFIGRSKECHIYLKPKYINTSRYHAKVQLVELNGQTHWKLWDLDTPNGTFINGERVTSCLDLKSGDQIVLGRPSGARLSFEWKAIHLTQINEIFREKPSYDETIVSSSLEENHGQESKTNLFIEEPDSAASELPVDNGSALQVAEESSLVLNQELEPTPFPRKERSRMPVLLRNGALLSLLILMLFAFAATILNSIALQNSRTAALSTYINNISQLLLDKQLSSLDSFNADARKARNSANGQTLTTLKELDRRRKGKLLRFLHGAKLIKIQPQELGEEWLANKNLVSRKKVLLLSSAMNRSEFIYARGMKLDDQGTIPMPVFIDNALTSNKFFVQGKNFSCNSKDKRNKDCAQLLEFKYKSYEKPFLTPIQLSGADLLGTYLRNAPLENINLEGAYLSTRVCDRKPADASIQATLSSKLTNWLNRDHCRADFSGAGLQHARLFRSVLMGANLRNAKLDYADLRQVDLRGADLTGVSWQGALLRGACYLEEDWQQHFPEKGPNGSNFDPKAEGMKAIPRQESDISKPLFFKECKGS